MMRCRPEIEAIRRVCRGQTLKVIIETCLLTEAEKVRLCQVVTDAGADFIKTSTGVWPAAERRWRMWRYWPPMWDRAYRSRPPAALQDYRTRQPCWQPAPRGSAPAVWWEKSNERKRGEFNHVQPYCSKAGGDCQDRPDAGRSPAFKIHRRALFGKCQTGQ